MFVDREGLDRAAVDLGKLGSAYLSHTIIDFQPCDHNLKMPKPNLLLCFDAFGTLFRPKKSIFEQYGEVARQLGMKLPNNDQLQVAFRNAFKAESRQHPNYGRSTGLGATKWWTAVS